MGYYKYKYVSIATSEDVVNPLTGVGAFKHPRYSAVVQKFITALLLASIVCYKHYSVAEELLLLKEF